MSPEISPIVVDRQGQRASIVPDTSGVQTTEPTIMLQLEDGQFVQVPAEILVLQANGTYMADLNFREFTGDSFASATSLLENNTLRIPVIEEQIVVDKRIVDSGRVRITKQHHEHEEVIDEPLTREEVEVERITINQMVEGVLPTTRTEGDTLIIPLFEEVLVVQVRIRLKEELHVHRRQKIVHEPQQITLRSEEVSVERLAPLAEETTESSRG